MYTFRDRENYHPIRKQHSQRYMIDMYYNIRIFRITSAKAIDCTINQGHIKGGHG